MSEVTIRIDKKYAAYLNEKGFAEIFIRTTQGKCLEITKCLIKENPEKAEEIIRIAEKVMKRFAVNEEQLKEFRSELLQQINPQSVRRELRKISGKQIQDSETLKKMSMDIKNIFSDTGAIKGLTWLNSALSLCNLGATFGCSAIIGDKINRIDNKINGIETAIKKVDMELTNINSNMQRMEGEIKTLRHQTADNEIRREDDQEHTMHALFISTVKDPCRKLESDYVKLLAWIRKGNKDLEEKLEDFILDCRDKLHSILDATIDYPNWKSDMLNLIWDLLAAMTEMIIYYLNNYYYPEIDKEPMYKRWMDIYDTLSENSFMNNLRRYLFIDLHLHNDQVQKQADHFQMMVLNKKIEILQTLKDIKSCENAKKHNEFTECSNETTFKMVHDLMVETKTHFANEGIDIKVEKPREMNMYADAS